MSSTPPTFSTEEIPRIVIPGEVFERGAQQHKDFVVGRFFGRVPAFKTIQSVLNYLWGKGNKLDIHMIQSTRSVIVRIPNDYIREKILKKRIWYVDTAMFHIAQWSDGEVADTSSLEAVSIWKHLIGVPFDVMTIEGLGWIADAPCNPKEMHDWTENLSSLSVAYVKVEADATKPFPSELELVRQSGAVFRVQVEYPWLPPTCSHCQELGHILKDCLKVKMQWVPVNRENRAHGTRAKLEQLLSIFCPRWNYISNHNTDEGGRLIIIWKPLSRSKKFTKLNGLLEIQQNYYLENQSWLIGGDLNQIIHHVEYSSLSVNHLTADMDLRFQGNSRTWTNKRPENPVTKKLDRAMVNSHWIRNFPNSIATFLPHEFSDHSPCIVNLACPFPSSGTKPFKFYNLLTSHPNFLSSTEAARPLKTLHKESFSNIQKRVQAMANPSTTLFNEERELQEKNFFIRGIEESFFHQKSRVNWLRLGDHNTPFYQSVAASHASQNSIRSITFSDGSIITDPDLISSLAIAHFQAILAPVSLPSISASCHWLQSFYSLSCSDHHRQLTATPPTLAEIANVLKNLNPKGGFGLRNLEAWNMACALKMIWLLFFVQDSIWSSWFTAEIFEGNIELFWRNNRLHNAHFIFLESLLAQIKLTVKNRISSLRTDRPKFSFSLLQLRFST
ncbi:hypothetical protein Bca52824_014752 [Brassica carinata]|uniref:DUF4283 domain-containing protein n=1 Tax=Brassica carinata TaxID=52824 RepID=A0A8X7W0Q1_BRACI|nr:hypothetical protein Bca52824_014752 [Brassica carinata]